MLEVISDSENKLLGRREMNVRFRSGSGILTRQAAAEAISSKVGTAKEQVQVLSLKGKFGVRDIEAHVYVFSNANDAKRQLSDYILLRHLPKEERKKLREEKRKAATSQSSGGGEPSPSPAPAKT
jgi:ribosomal protein S24E